MISEKSAPKQKQKQKQKMGKGEGEGEGEGGVMRDMLAKGREGCYKARDAFYACVDKASEQQRPTEIATGGLLFPARCSKTRALYVSSWRPSWVRHFDRQYCAKKRVQRLLDSDDARRGPITLPQPSTFKT